MNEKLIRPIAFIAAALLHLVIIMFVVFSPERPFQVKEEDARVLKLTDFQEFVPPPPPPEQETRQEEEIAETMTETDAPPPPEGSLSLSTVVVEEDYYYPAHMVSHPPQFDTNAIAADLVYPPVAFRSGIEGRVILELLIDSTGTVQRVIVLFEEPKQRGFGEAAVKAFTGRKGQPALANGVPVPTRYRYPVSFVIR